MTLIVGVDPSAKHIAMVAVETTTGTFKHWKSSLYAKGSTKQTARSLGTAWSAMAHFVAEITPMIAQGSEPMAYVEYPVVARGGVATTLKQGYVGGIIRGCLAANGFAVYDANLSSWRKELGIVVPVSVKGGHARTRAFKDETKKALAARWPKVTGTLGDDADLIDAGAIAYYGARQADKGTRLGAARSPLR